MNDREFILKLIAWLESAGVLSGSYFLARLKAIANGMDPETCTCTPAEIAEGRRNIV